MVFKKESGKGPTSASLLVELLTEELPPRSLRALGEAFAEQLVAEIVRHRLKDRVASKQQFATPRRLAVLIQDVRGLGLDSEHEVEGPIRSNGRGGEGFAKKHNIARELLERRQTSKGEIVVAHLKMSGVKLDSILPSIVDNVIKKLAVSKVMRWGDGQAQFVRPVHGLVMMHGKRVVPGIVLGVRGGNTTSGHRFMGAASIRLSNADDYEASLLKDGRVIADFAARKSEIDKQLQVEAKRQKASLGEYQDLLDEVTALVEFPAIYAGTFDASFLEVPQECLILTMRQNQKYFPLFARDGKLLPKFLIVSNMRVDPRVPQLAKVVFHSKLGSQLERVQRIKLLAGEIARSLRADVMQAERAAELSKADLLTAMVGEFPELQGVMGRYYALHDGEQREVADAIEQHYRPRFAGAKLPEGPIASAVALADKLDSLAALFSINELPTGDKDPFGLRRAALGVIRIVVENQLPLSLRDLLDAAFGPFRGKPQTDLKMFFTERMRSYFLERGYSANEVEAVLSLNPVAIALMPKQLEAVRAFSALPEAASLATANKRIGNIVRQAENKGEAFADADFSALKEPAEVARF